MNNTIKRLLSIALAVTLTTTMLPTQVFASSLKHPLDYLGEVEMADDILQENVFYFATVDAHLQENSGMSHVLRIGRGGLCEEAASVTVKISDYSAHYGEDYTVALLDGKKADAPKDMYALTDLMTGDYEAGAIADEEEVLDAMENEQGFAEEAADAINSAIDFIEENAGLEMADNADEEMTLAEVSAEAEKVFKSPLQQAYAASTGITADRQKVTADGSSDPLREMQNIANLVNDLTIGAALEVPFAAGQESCYIMVTPKNNGRAEGNRYFYLTLTDPQGATVSSSASCAVTILDDEEVGPCKVSFDGYEINEDNTSVRVYVKREGCLNQITDVTLSTTDGGTAVQGRDYSPVDTSVIFPIGVPELPVDIPINTQYFTGEKTFELALTPYANAEVPEQESRLSVSLFSKPLLLAGAGTQTLTRSLATVELDKEHALKENQLDDTAFMLNHTTQYDGNNCYDAGQKGWLTEWISYWDWGWEDGNVSVCFPIGTFVGNSVTYSGVNMDIKKNGDCAVLGVGFGWAEACRESGTNVSGNGMECVYWSSAPFEGNKNFFSSADAEYADWNVKIENASNCDDCNRIWVKSVTPIFRWYELTIKTKQEDRPTFLTAGGEYKVLDNKDDTVHFNSENNEKPGTALTHSYDTLTMYLGDDGAKYLTLTDITGAGVYRAGSDLVALGSGVYEWEISDYTIREGVFGNATFHENPHQTGAGGNHPKYGSATLYATFAHKPATVKINDVPGFEGTTLNLSGTEYGEGTYTFNKGDIIRISCPNVPAGYRFAGVEVKSKINETDVAVRSGTICVDEDGALFLDGDASNRLQKGYYEITPIFEKKENAITILVKESDIKNKLAVYGIFDEANIDEYQSLTIDGYNYRKYRMEGITAGRIYSLPVMTTRASYFPQWTTADGKKYSGSVFYLRPDVEPDNNVLTLSIINSEMGLDSLTMSGTIVRNNYNVSTKITENGEAPFENVLVICGAGAKTESMGSFEGYTAASAITNLAGRYSLDLTVKKGTALRYLVTYNGKTDLRELSAEEICSAIDQDDGKLTNNLTLNTENGSLLSLLSVTTDNASGAGRIITMFNGEGVTLTVSDGGGCAYKKVVPQDNGLFKEEQAIERLTALEVVIRDINGNERTTVEAKKDEDGNFKAFISYSGLQGGDRIYLKATSDREPTGLVPLDKKVVGDETWDVDPSSAGIDPVTFYHEIFSGYTFAENTGTEVPTYIQFNSVPDIQFISLPMIDEMGFYCDFPFVHVNAEKVGENSYLMSIGAGVMDIVDAVKGSNTNQYNNGGIYDAFLQTDTSSLISSFKSGMQSAANLIDNVRQSEKAGTSVASSLGGPSWRFNIAVGAYMKFELLTINEEYDFFLVGVGGYLGVQGGFRWNVYWAAPVVCVPMYFGVQADVMVNGYFGSSVDPDVADNPVRLSDVTGTAYTSGNLDTFDCSVRMLFNGAIYLGVGLCGTLGVRGGGQVSISALWQNNKPAWMENDWGAAIVFKAGIWLDLFIATIPIMYSFPQITLGSVKEIRDRASQDAVLLSGGARPIAGEFRFRDPYTDERSDWMGDESTESFGFRTVKTQDLVENPYEHPDAQLCELDNGKALLAFIDSNGNKDAASRTELKVSVYENDNKSKWSDPITVQDDGTSDFQPRLAAMKDGKALLAWVSAAPGGEDVEGVSEYLSSLEIYAAVIDTESGELIGEPYRLTEDEYYDSQPVCVYDDVSGEYAVFYVKADPFKNNGTAEFKTPDAIANPYTNDSVVAYMLHADVDGEGGKWLDDRYFKNENALPDEWNGQRFFAAPIRDLGIYSPAIADLTAAVYNGKIIFAYTIDGDSDNETDADKELYVQTYDFSKHEMDDPIRITSDAISDVRPQLVENRVNDEEAVNLFWFRGGRQIAYTHISDLLKNGISDHAISKDYKVGKHTEEKEAGLERIYSYVRPSGVSEDALIGMSNFRVVTAGDHGEDIYVVWTQAPDDESGAEGCVELYATAFLRSEESTTDPKTDPDNEGTDWARPYRLSQYASAVPKGYASIVDEPTAALLGDGVLVVVSNRYYQQFTDDPDCPVVFSDLKLTATTMEPCGSVDVTDIRFSDQTPLIGDTLKVTVDVQNTGIAYAKGYTLDVSVMKDDAVLKQFDTIRCDTPLRPGENRTEEITWVVSENVNGAFVRTSTMEIGGRWNDASVSLSEYFKEAADLTLAAEPVPVQTGNGMALRFSILNSGSGVSSGEDVLRVLQVGPYCNNCGLTDDERLFAEVSLAGISPGESRDFEVGLKAPISCFDRYGYVECYAYVVQGEEEKLGKSVMIKPEKPLEVLLNGKPVPETMTMTRLDTLPLAVSVMPAFKETALFTSSNEAVVSIENGELVANKPGTAELTCLLMPLGMKLDPITVTVKADTETETDTGTDTETDALAFVDIAEDAYYADAVRWAAANGITKGTDNTHFSPDGIVTRAQMVTFLWRAAGCPEPTGNAGKFTDVESGSYYEKAVAWAVAQGITKGTGDTTFSPDTVCTRGQTVTFLARFAGVADANTASVFTDVQASDYFSAAVKWAKDNGVTSGTSATTFSPNTDCTRAQTVTFLYRLMVEARQKIA